MRDGWATLPLGDVATVAAGNSAPQEEGLFQNGRHPFFRTSDVGRIHFGEIYESVDRLNVDGIRGLRSFPKGTILFPKSGASTFLNHRVIMGVEGYVSNHLAAIVSDPARILPQYLLYFLMTVSTRDMIQDHAYPSLNLPTIGRIKVMVPPLADQERIVRVLNEVFQNVAIARANAEKNLQNAGALFETQLQAIFHANGDSVRLSEITSEITDGDHSPPPKAPSGVPFITISDIEKRTRTIDFTETFFVPREYFGNLKANKKPKRGDVLYTVTGATLGIPVLVDRDVEFCFQRHIGLIRPAEGTDSSWLNYALLSPQVFLQATQGSTGAAQKTVSLSVLRNISVPRVSLSKQRSVAAELDALAEETRRLETIYRRKLVALEALKKSLLHEAFCGRL